MVTCTGEVISRAFGRLVFQLGQFYKPIYHTTTKKLSLKKYRGRNGCWLPPCHCNMYGLRLWFTDRADLSAGCPFPALITSLALRTGVCLGSEVQGTEAAEAK